MFGWLSAARISRSRAMRSASWPSRPGAARQLERDRPVHHAVAALGQPDAAHAALGQEAQQAIGPDRLAHAPGLAALAPFREAGRAGQCGRRRVEVVVQRAQGGDLGSSMGREQSLQPQAEAGVRAALPLEVRAPLGHRQVQAGEEQLLLALVVQAGHSTILPTGYPRASHVAAEGSKWSV